MVSHFVRNSIRMFIEFTQDPWRADKHRSVRQCLTDAYHSIISCGTLLLALVKRILRGRKWPLKTHTITFIQLYLQLWFLLRAVWVNERFFQSLWSVERVRSHSGVCFIYRSETRSRLTLRRDNHKSASIRASDRSSCCFQQCNPFQAYSIRSIAAGLNVGYDTEHSHDESSVFTPLFYLFFRTISASVSILVPHCHTKSMTSDLYYPVCSNNRWYVPLCHPIAIK